jgi:gliding motility-associated-like protein
MIMKKPTILRTLIFVLTMLLNFASYSQNLVAYNSKFNTNLNENLFFKTNNQIENQFSLNTNEDKGADKLAAPMVNPAIKYAKLPYLGTVSICPNDGKELPKLFLCGSNETRKIETGLINPQLIIWEKFTAGGACLNVSNTNCANETSAASCWSQVGNTVDYVASAAGQYRIRIVDSDGTPYTFYFNVYQNTLDPGAIAKNDIIKYGTTCTIDGKITVNGFGSGYEYGLTTTSSPPSTWQTSNVFSVTAAGNYNVFIRLSGVAGSCDFKVPNIVIKQTTFAVTTQINSPKCSAELGSIHVIASDVNLQYVYKLTGTTNITVPATTDPTHTFTGLASGTYTVETSIVGKNCMKDTKTDLVIVASPDVLKNTSTLTTALSACATGEITGSATGGKTPYRYSISIDGGAFTAIANVDNKITVAKAGNYIVRLEDGNGCTADQAITVGAVDKPVYNVSKVDGNCTGSAGSITVNVTAANGFTDIKYSKDNGTTFGTSNTFTGLAPGIYYVVVQYKKTGVSGSSNAYCQDPAIMTNVGAATPLSASGGIAALSGCGIAPNEDDGLARIVNPQGGVPFSGPFPYKYSFDDGLNWQDSNEAYIKPNATYIFKIKDAVGCVFDMPGIKLDAKPAKPTIKVLDPVFNCDGSATTTVTVNGGVPDTKYSYKYYMDGFLNNNTPSNVFLNVGEGKHTVTVEYTVLNVSTYSNLLIENFGSGGTTTTPGIAGTYCFNDQRVDPPYTCSLNGTPTRSVEDNQYSVTNFFWRSDDPTANNSGAWYHFKDHTTAANATPDAQGRYLLINIGKAAGDYGVLYSKDIVDVIPNQPVMIDLYVANLLRRSKTGAAPILIFELVDQAGNVVATDKTGKIAEDAFDADRNKWINKSLSLDPGNNTKLTFKIRSGSTEYGGNDLVMDDIWVRQIPRACGTVQDFDINIDPAKAFSADITGVKDVLCKGDKNGELTITARNFDSTKGFQYSMDNGANWTTVKPVPAATTGSVTVKNLGSQNYLIKVRYEPIATSCTLPFSQDIKEPEALKISASVTKVATCLFGATITAVATDGTPDYKYELRASNGTTVVRAFQDSGEFLDVPVGNYKVIAKDANKCETNILASVVVVAAVKPTVTFVPGSLCFDSSTGTNITVKVTGGVPDYTYTVSFNGGAPSVASAPFTGPNFTYNAANAGTYKFEITDSFGCVADAITQTITGQLLLSTPVTTPLDCDPAPANRAVITGTITGGKKPFSVTITAGNTSGTLVQPTTTGNTFTYTTAVTGNYTFQIKDANNCITTSDATISPLIAVTGNVVKATDPSCYNGANGQIEIAGGGGSGTYTYSFNGSAFTSKTVYTGLDAKTTTANTTKYTYQIKDNSGCLSPIYDVTLNNPTPVVASANFPANTACSATTTITVSGAGGSGGYKYSFNGNTTYTGTNTLLVTLTSSAQVITYSVQDSNGCTDTKTINVPAYNPPTGINFSTPATLTCLVTSTSVTLTSVGGISPYTYSIISGPTTAASNTTGIFAGLTAGTYVFEVKDANGCTKQASLPISGAATISAAQASTDVLCFGNTNGTATFTVTGASSVGNFTYTITPASGTVSVTGDVVKVTGLGAGSYTFQAKDKTTGCSSNSVIAVVNAATAITFTAQGTKINCNEKKSTITFPTLSGGKPGYTYAYIATGPTAPAAGAYSSSTIVDTALLGLNIDVWVKDINGCTAKQSITIGQETPPQINTPAAQCYTGTAISVTITGLVVGTPTYSIDNVTYGSNPTFNLGVGPHTLYIKDGFGCMAQTSYTVAPQLTLSATPAVDTSCTTATTINLAANGGTGTYTYEVSNGGAYSSIPGNTYTTSTAGTYTFRVTDSATPKCSAVSNAVVVNTKATTLTLNTSKTDVKCFSDATGTINITPTSGKSPYTYNVTKGGTSVSTTASTTGLTAGVYNITITDALGCTGTASVTITEPTDLIASANFPANTACSATTTITVSGAGGSGGYKYSFNGNTTYTGTNTLLVTLTSSAQVITYSVQDSNGCTDTKTINVPAYNPPTGINFSTPATLTCLVTSTSVTLTSVGGISPYTYSIISGPTTAASNTTGIFAGLTAGTYVFEVKDANGCTKQASLPISGAATISAAQASTDVLCFGNTNGTATFTVTGASSVGNFTYTITPASGTVSVTGDVVKVTGLGAGSYTFQAKDKTTGCSSNSVIAVVNAATAITFTAQGTKINCNEKKSTITFPTLSGGKPGYTYAYIATGPTAPAAGAYSSSTIVDTALLGLNIDVWVKDINGCTAKQSITIGQETPPQINTPAAQCYTGTAISVTITGLVVGTPTYSIDNVTYGSNPTFNLGVGPHTLYIKDGFGCMAQTSYTVAPQLTLSATPAVDTSCTTATTINLAANGGTGTYTYEVSNGGAYSSIPGNTYTTSTAGTYTFRVTDSATPKCSAVSNAVVVNTKATTLTLNTSKTDVKCFSDATGTINITPTSGKSPYTYNVTKGGTSVSTTASTTGLTAGVYNITITDALGCTGTASVTITEPTDLIASANFPANTACSATTTITVSGAGGSGGYKYSFNGNTTYTGTNTLLVTLTSSAQVITYSVQDSNGCTDTKTINVPAYNPPTGINFSTPATLTCLVTSTSVTLTSVGGISPYTYSIISGPTTAASNTTGIFAGLTAGTYVFEVKDANGCTKQASLPISGAATISAAQASTDVLCFGNTNGTATFTVTGASSVGNFTYTITPASGTVSVTGDVVKVTGLGAGSYTFQAKDKTTGCSSNSVIAVVNAATAITFTAQGTKINCNEKKSTITFPTLSGGKPGYTYAYIATGPTAPAAGAYSSSTIVDTALLGLNIDVWVKDINGCTAKQSITIGQETPPQINTPAAQCYTGTAISVTITGLVVGTPTYSIDNVTYGSNPTFNLGVGPHTLYIKDGFGCMAQTSYTVAPQLTLSATPAVDTSCTTATTINLAANGGTGTYTYEVSNGGAYSSIPGNTYTTSTAGTYTFRVTDSATPKCSAVSNAVVVNTKATTLTLNTSKTDVKCFSDATGTINITPTSGKSPYTYNVTKGGTSVSTTASTTGLTAGVYNITITDALGCTGTASVTITEPTAVTASATAPATTTCSTSTLVTVTGNGGTGTYTYSINGGAFVSTNTLVINDNGSDQNIPYRVRDANGCTTPVQNILIKKLNPPTITNVVGTPIYCSPAASTTSTITVTTSNGLLPLTYSISPSAGITSPTGFPNKFEGLVAGVTYLVTVTDANGCSDTESHTVAPVTPIAIAGQNVSNVLCNGGSTGIAKYTVSGFSATGNYDITVTTVPAALPFTQTISGDVITLSNLAVGSYKVEVKDRTTGCLKDDTVTITEPPVLTLTLASNVNANCSVPTAKVIVTAGGGTPFAGNTYSYAFKQNNVAPTASDYGTVFTANLNPTTNLNWDVWVKDAKGCETKLDVTIAKDLAPTVTATVQNQCTGSGSLFTIKAVGSGGVGAYTYTINTGAAPTGALLDTFTVAAGTYTITVKDANGCPNNTIVTVNAVLTASAILTKNLTCSAPTAATITIIAGGGKAGYSYRVSSDGGLTYSTTGISGNIFTTNTAGDYQFEVTDSNLPTACIKITNSVKVIDAATVTASTEFVGPGCNGNTNGYIELKGLTGEAPFKYSITGIAGTFVSTNIFTDLAAGSYDWVVKDNKGCTVIGNIVLSNPAPIAVTVTPNPIQCHSNIPGDIDVVVNSGGVAPFVYTLYDNTFAQVAVSGPVSATSYNFPGLSFGDYYVTVVDAKGCEFKAPKKRINTLPRLTFSGLASTGSCATGAYVDINVVVGTGNGPFTYSIYGQPLTAVTTAALTHQFTGLAHGVTYLFQVVDNGLCSSVIEVTTPTLSPINVVANVTSNVTCATSNEGAISFNISNYHATTTSISYEIRDQLTNLPISPAKGATVTGLTGANVTGTITGLKAGAYTLYVKEVNGTECSTATTFLITQPLPVNALITSETNANSCNTGTQIRVAATGGTAPYEYAFVQDGVAPATFYTTSSLGTLNPFPAPLKLDWDIWVKDANGCEFKLDHTITVDPSPVIALSVADKCVDEGTFSINVNAVSPGFGTYMISVNDGDFVSIPGGLPHTVNGLSSGPNKIIIKDANGCTDTKSITIDKPLEMTPVVTLPNCNDSDGIITLTGTGGTGLYTYSILPASGTVTANVISGLSPGDYIVTMTDTATPTACSITTKVTIPSAVAVTFNTVTTKVSCFGSSDGTITVNLPTSNNNPVYTYAILPAVGTQNDNIFTGLPAGTYRITVTSGRGCSAFDANVIVGTPAALTALATITDYTCSGNVPQPAKVTVNVNTVSGVLTGTGPYKYNFDGSSTYNDSNELYVVDNGAPQTVHFYVKDANGCLFDDQVIVPSYKKITNITFISSAPTCPVPTVNVQLTVVGGYNITKYEIVSPTPLNNSGVNVFNGLTADTTYLFKVTDDHGCSFEKSFTTPKLTPIAIVGDLVSDISCNPANGTTNNGVARYTVTGFSSSQNYTITVTTTPAALSYVLTQPVGTDFINLTNLSAGTYKVEVRDNVTGCIKDASVTITTPVAIAFTATATKVFCSRDESEITVNTPSGGTGVYSYAVVKALAAAPALTDYVSGNILKVDTNLTDLSWDVYVKDANNCVAKITVPVIYNAAPSITAPAPQCYTGSNLTVDLSTVTGVYAGTKIYTLDGVELTSSIATLTAPGTYVLGVKDDNGCEAFVNYTIAKQMLSTAALTKDLYCTAPVNATIDVKITDGIGMLSTQMYSGVYPTGTAVGTAYAGATFTASVAAAGDYYFVTTDSNAAVCTAVSNPVKVNAPLPTTIAATPVTQPILCAGGTATMQINVDATAGLEPFTYSVRKTAPVAAPATVQLSNNVFTGLTAGDYEIIVTDAKGCASTAVNTTITEPVILTATVNPLPINTTCSTATVITVVGHDGTPLAGGGYYYNFNHLGYTTSNTFTVNDNGAIQTITYSVKDANGCETADQTINVNPLNKPTDLAFTPTAITCKVGENVSTVLVKATNGVGVLRFEIIATNTATPAANFGPITTTGSAVAASFPGLLPGNYTFKVTDSNGCTYQELMTIDNVVPIAMLGELVSDISCNPANGTTNNGVARYTVTGFSVTHNYSVAVTTTPALLTYTLAHPVGSDVITLSDLAAGTYQVTVTDLTTGCIKDASVTITTPVAIAFTATATKVFCSRDESEITVNTPSGGTGVYSYAVVKALAAAPALTDYVSGNILKVDTNLTDLSWDVYVKDANNCVAKITVPVIYNAAPSITAPAPQCYTGSNLTVDLSTVTGVYAGTKIYTLDGVELTSSIATLTAPGTYVLGVKDDNGCEAFVNYTIAKQMLSTAALTKDLYCTAPVNATIDVKITDGIGMLSTQMYSGVYPTGTAVGTAYAGATFTASVAAAGDYYFVTTDSNAAVCTAVSNPVKVNAPLPTTIAATPVTQPILCAGGTATMQINVDATAGLEPFTYSVRKTAPVAAPATVQLSNNVFTGLTAGDYEIIVTDAKGCASTAVNTTITEPVILTATVNPLPINTTCSTATVITVVGHDGTPLAGGGYYYNFNHLGYTTSNTFTVNDNGAIQTITYSVKDANGCETADQTINVNPLNKPTDLAFTPTAITCKVGENVSTVLVKATNGVGVLRFEIIATNTATPAANFGPITTTGSAVAASFPGLLPGNYTFKVTDSNGCTYQELMTIDNVVPIAMLGELVSDISCNPANGTTNNGVARYTVTGFSVTHNYSVAVTTTPALLTYTLAHPVGSDVITLSNLAAGTYQVTVTDLTTGCIKDASVTITTPVAIAFTATATKVFCSRDESEITVNTPSGGTGVYSYAVVKALAAAPALTDYVSGNILKVDTNLTDLSWDVYVKDANNCVAKITVPVIYNAAPSITAPAPQCYTGSNLTVDLSTVTGVYAGTKIYTLDGVELTSSIATLTAPGTYVLGVKDDNGCEAFVNYTIAKQMLSTAALTKDLYCTAPVNATIDVKITDGIGTLSTQMYSGVYPTGTAVGTAYAGATFTASVAAAGDYYFVTTDSNAAVCTAVSNPVKVNAPLPTTIAATPVTQPILCAGGTATMQINVDATAGLEPFTYSVRKTAPVAAPATVQLSNNVFTGLTAGDYEIIVTDAKGCASTAVNTTITEPVILTATVNPLPINTTCSTATVITVVGHDGTPLAGGGYYYNFNHLGYTTSNTFTVNDNGAIQTITYSVKDANGCETADQTINVNPLNKPTDLAFTPTAITCKVGENVSTVLVKATNGVGVLTFEIIATNTATPAANFGPITTTGSAVAASFPGLLPGNYTFKVTDSNGCTYQELMTIDNVVNIAADGQLIAGVACKGEANGKVTFTVSGFGALGFTPTFTGVTGAGVITPVGTDKFELTNLIAGTYKIDVIDNTTNCVSTYSVIVPEPATLGLNYATVTNANCTDGSVITATAFDGTPGYMYAFVKTGDPKVYTNSDTATLDKASTWVVWAKDANGCEISMPITIITDPMPTITTVVATQCPSATGTYDITVTATGFTANLEYSLDGNTWQLNNNVLTVNSTGVHTVYVRDENQCPVTSTVTILEPLQLLYDITTTPICNGNEGVVTLTASGGTVTPSYEYSINGGAYVGSPVFTGLVPGTYTFTVRDTGTNCTKSVTVVIETPNTAIDFSLTPVKVICNGESNGTVTVNMATPTSTVNNNPVYTYAISPAPAGMVLVGNVFTNLPEGTYTVTVTSGKGCPVSKVVTVDEPAIIVVDAPVVSQYGCTGDNKANYATVTIDKTKITGGSGNYTRFQFIKTSNANEIVYEGSSNVYTESDFLGGKYIVNVFDDKGCMAASTEVEILPFTNMDKIDVAVTPITCATNEDITVTVKDFNGATFTIPLQYKLDGVNGTVFTATNATGLFTNIPVGHYLISVTNLATGCVIKKDHFVNDPNTFTLTAENVTNIKCYGAADGSVDLVLVDNVPLPINEAGEFKYDITDALGNPVQNGTSDASGKATITGLIAGTYHVKARLSNTPFCDVVTSFTIQQPIAELKIFEVHAPISCTPGNDGKITISADGGWPGAYQYELVGVSTGYSSQFEFTDLSAGTYTLNVKDTGGCIATTTVALANPTPIVATATATANTLACFGDKSGVITVSAPTGGQGSNYAYILNMLSATPVVSTVSQASPVFTGLGAGRYSVTIIDQLSCSGTTAEVTIDEPTEIVPKLELATGITCKTDATLTLSAVGGTGSYEYSADKNFTTVLGTLPATFSVGLGNHQYFVRDSKGCVSSISNNVTIDPLTPLSLKLDLSNALVYCKGSSTAAIDAEAVGGLTNYVYTLFDGNGVLVRPAQPTGYFDLLPKGVYVVRVDSGDCQFNSASITINEPAVALSVIPTVTDATCFGANDGKIVIAATGGTGVIKYAISPNLGMFDDVFVFDRLAAGKYQVLVQDENSCFQLLNLEVKEPTVLGAKVVGPIIQEICDGDKDGSFTVEISGGRPPYTISLDNENGPYIPVVGTQHTFSNLKGGTHNVFIKDVSCVTLVEVAMDKPVILDPTAEISYDCVNNAQSNMVTITVDESITNLADVDYALDGTGTYQPSNIFTNLAPGNHYVTARHTNGCEVRTVSFAIKAYDPLGIKLSAGQAEMNVISVTGTGGAPAYEYSFNGEPFTSSNTYKIYKSGDYVVVVRDQNGCTATITIPMVYIDVCLDNYFTPNGDGVYDTWGPGCTNIYNNLEFSIFDRYGRVIAKYHYGQKWDGRYNGEELPSGDYWYVLKLNDEKDAREFVGHFTLYR